MAHRSQSSSIGDNPLDPNYLPPHYREEYRLAIDALIENDTQGYYEFLQTEDVASFLAQPEIEFIKNTIQMPNLSSSMTELTYRDAGQGDDGSSDTYWPVQSDLAAPALDLGWPQLNFIGRTEVTTLVNPSETDMPSIKEQARRLIKTACQVIAVVMDTFTDIDIFADLLDAARRHVPVYILLDEQESDHFVSMVLSCKVNLEAIPMMRVRTVAGITYYSRTGKSFKGQVKDRFLLADCRAVLSGNYSFMWSYEKIHRCIAHLFLGELVTTFDEEFRILYAQSEPLVIDPSDAVALPDTNNYFGNQFGLKRTQSLRNPIGYRRHELPFGDPERNRALPFRRNDPFRQTVEPVSGVTIGKYSQQQFRPQQSYLEQGRSIVSRQIADLTSYKRHSYAEGTQESYGSARQYMKNRVMNNLDETDFKREQTQSSHYYNENPGPGSGHGQYDRHRGLPPHITTDQYSESSFRSDPEPFPGSYGRDYFSSEDLGGPEGHRGPPLAGRYGGGSSHKRPSIGQTYACQSSPTQPHPPEKKQFLKERDQSNDQDADVRHGLRNWRISSYLSTYEDSGEEGLAQPMGPDAFEDPPVSQPANATEKSGPSFGVNEPPKVPPKPRPDILRPRFGKPVLSENKSRESPPGTVDALQTGSDLKPFVAEREKERIWETEREKERSRGKDRGMDMEVKEAPDLLLSKHESFRTRINPLLQRSSRLRSSLIFSSSKAEMHNSGLGLRPATEEDEQLDSVRTSSIVAQILEKRKFREPFEWRKKAEEKTKEPVQEKDEKEEKEPQEKNEARLKDEGKTRQEPHKTTAEIKLSAVERTKDPTPSPLSTNESSTQQYLKDLIAKRKASKIEAESQLKASEPAEKKPDLTDKPPLKPVVPPSSLGTSVVSGDAEPKKIDISAKLSELNNRQSASSSKPPATAPKPSASHLKPETTQPSKEENSPEGQKKDIFKSLKPLPSPKIFRKAPLKLKSLNPRRVSSGDEVLTTDATDAEKSELKKSRTQSSSTLSRDDFKEGWHKVMGSNTSINTLGEAKAEGKKHWFKGILGSKDKDKKSSADDKAKSVVIEVTDETGKKQSPSAKDAGSTTIAEQTPANSKTSTGVSGPSRYQSAGSSVIFSSNLRDDTKVILEQISAHSQKNRAELEETAGDRGDSGAKSFERHNSVKASRFLRPQGNIQEREGLLKRIESLRKEKKVYSRFEMGNNLG